MPVQMRKFTINNKRSVHPADLVMFEEKRPERSTPFNTTNLYQQFQSILHNLSKHKDLKLLFTFCSLVKVKGKILRKAFKESRHRKLSAESLV
jgi:hypothetical protein